MPPPGEDVGDCDKFDGNVGGIWRNINKIIIHKPFIPISTKIYIFSIQCITQTKIFTCDIGNANELAMLEFVTSLCGPRGDSP